MINGTKCEVLTEVTHSFLLELGPYYFESMSLPCSDAEETPTALDVEEVAAPLAMEEDTTTRSVEKHSRMFHEKLNAELKEKDGTAYPMKQ